MKINRRFTKDGQDVYSQFEWTTRTSRITNPDGSVVFEMTDAHIPANWSQLATDIMVSKYFRKAGVPVGGQQSAVGGDLSSPPTADRRPQTGPEKSAKQVIHRLAGCWRHWGETHGYFDTAADAQTFYDELAYMMLDQACAPNSPQWFNTGLHFAYGITGPAQGHFFCDPSTGEMRQSENAYEHPQPHACFIQSVADDLVNPGGIMDLWTREARLFKYGSGTGSNFSNVRGDNEKLSGGGRSSGLMSFLKIGDRAAGAIKSGGTTRRAAKMCCLDLDHPDIEDFINWKVREELKVAALVEGMKVLPQDQKDLAKKLGLKLDYDFNGESYLTVSGQNSNNSIRIPNSFFEALDKDGDWTLTNRVSKKPAKTIKARMLWDEICFAAWRCADPGVQYDTTINQWHTCPASGRINASNPCVTGDTRVLTPGGIWRRIDQMIHLPARIVTNVDGKEIHVVEGAFPTGTKDVYELRTDCGYSLKCTADHKIWTRSRGWVEAQHLTADDELRLMSEPACVEEVGEPVEARLFQMAGFLLSDANSSLVSLKLDAVLGTNVEQIDAFAGYVGEVWGNPEVLGEIGGTTLTTTLTNRRLLSRIGAFIRVERDCGRDAATGRQMRRLSDDAFTSGCAAQKHLLRGLFTADADVIDGSVVLFNDSRGLLQDVQLLLMGFGVQSRIVSKNSDGGAVARGGFPSACGALASSHGATDSRHGLRIDEASLRAFGTHIAFLPGEKLAALASAVGSQQSAADEIGGRFSADYLPPTADRRPPTNTDRLASFTHLGPQQVFDLTEPVTSSFVANGITVHNCSEYMFLDDTACNLASLNVMRFFDPATRKFDVDAYRHGIRLWTIVLEISVLMASFPSEEIARLSYKFRTLGLGYANVGALLMQAGIPYDSEQGRAFCAAITAILTGESYATSAEMAGELGAFAGYAENKSHMLRVIENHRRAAFDAPAAQFEGVDIKPVGIHAKRFDTNDSLVNNALLDAARQAWDRALHLGQQHGYRNAQTTCIAPTGTIGLLMDCDTTGVEPDFALVKFKKLAGGGYFKIVNQSVEPALRNLRYSELQIKQILTHVLGTLSLQGAPHINTDTLAARGFTPDELAKIEQSLPAMFELGFAFSPWTLGKAFFDRMNIPEAQWQAPKFNLLKTLGFKQKQIDAASAIICGTGTVEGAPHLKAEHLPVFDCANKCGKTGQRFIHVEGHIRMMAAAQPFISGAISKTINLPNEATEAEIAAAYRLSWELGLKANALYRDGSKLSQPLNIKSDEQIDDEESEENVAAAVEEITEIAATAAASSAADRRPPTADQNVEVVPTEHTRVIERIIERIVERPLRRRLPDTRNAITHKFDISGHEGYITVGLYEDGQPGEVFITMSKEGSTIGGLMDTIATLVSVALQYGVPVHSLVKKFEHVRFEPSGMTRNHDLPFAKSPVDYIFRWLAMEFIDGYRAANAPERSTPSPSTLGEGRGEGASARDVDALADVSTLHHKKRIEADSIDELPPAFSRTGVPHGKAYTTGAKTLDPLSQQGTQMQSDAPPCDSCGSITVRSGTCYKCLNCGNSMGCS